MPALYLVIVSALIAYRTYGAFLAAPMPARIQTVLTLAIMALLAVVMVDSLLRWTSVLRGRRTTVPGAGKTVPEAAGL